MEKEEEISAIALSTIKAIKQKLTANLSSCQLDTATKEEYYHNLVTAIKQYNALIENIADKLIEPYDTILLAEKDNYGNVTKDKFRITTNQRENTYSVMGRSPNLYLKTTMSSAVRKIYIGDSKALAVIGEKVGSPITYNRYHFNPYNKKNYCDESLTGNIINVEKKHSTEVIVSNTDHNK